MPSLSDACFHETVIVSPESAFVGAVTAIVVASTFFASKSEANHGDERRARGMRPQTTMMARKKNPTIARMLETKLVRLGLGAGCVCGCGAWGSAIGVFDVGYLYIYCGCCQV